MSSTSQEESPHASSSDQPEDLFADNSSIDGSQDDDDSALGDDDDYLSTASLISSVMKYRVENGRTYNGYGDRAYVLPNDESELDRLDFQHHLMRLTFKGKLILSPVGDKPLHRVLDVGTGTGIWAIEFGEEHPESQVIGVDVSPVQPTQVPPNVQFEIDDLEKTWTFSDKFDFINSRMMTGAFTDWRRYLQQCYDNLKPGGYLEIQDVVFPLRSDDSSVSETSAVYKWASFMLEASIKLGCPLNTAETSTELLKDLGFVNVSEQVYKWPQNKWPAEKEMKIIGHWTYENFTTSLNGISVALFTRGLNWTPEELEVFLVDVRKDMKNTKLHGYWPIYVISAQKPEL